MPGKKHPILTVLVILVLSAFILGMSMVIILKVFTPSSNHLSFNEKIGVIPIEGTITESMRITTQLVKLRKDKKIKAIILRINSPGGSVGPAQEIYREVRKTSKTKKVIASMGGVAASGGYYIAAAANKIVAEPGTITGSIGVIMEFVLLKDLVNKIGIKFEVLKSGEFKDVGSPHREMTERDRELVNDLIADIQNQFVEAVAKGRNLDVEQVKEIADGRIFSGARAKELGLIDVLGNFQDAVEMAKEMAGIKGDVTLVYPKKSGIELWERLMDSAAGSVAQLLQGMNSKVEYRWNGFAAS
ncbi:MAG: signal peptide peptidase SppA [Desulfobacterales bacterium]|nr:signal peptide peptidase SppA [Desulfobacterales bacterium]